MLLALLITVLLLCEPGSAEILGISEGFPCKALGGEKGTCRLLTDCFNPGNFKVEQPPICTFKGLVPIICCPDSTGLRDEDFRFDDKKNVTRTSQGKKAVEFCRNYTKTCQRQSRDVGSPIVLDGITERPYEHAYMAVIGYGDQANKVWNCGGSVISPRYLLSSASCADLSPLGPARWARLGGLEILASAFVEDRSAKDWAIVERIAHPEYRPGTIYHDIALLAIDQEIPFDLWIGPVCLHASRALPKNSATANIWSKGVAEDAVDKQTSTHLLEYNMTLYNVRECRVMFNGSDQLPRGIDSDSMFCAGIAEGTIENCAKETGGGPLLTDRQSPCTRTQIGVAIYRERSCGVPSAPTLYIRVNYYLPWIQKIVFPG